jgi:hypothetical protein
MRIETLATVFLLSTVSLAAARPDKCKPSADAGVSQDGTIRVVPTTEGTFEWQRKGTDGAFKTEHKAELVKVGHPHLRAFVFDSGTFVVVNTSGGLEETNRVVFYEPTGKVIRSLSIAELMTAEEMKSIKKSVSHIHWLKVEKSEYSMGASEKEHCFWLVTVTGRRVRIDEKTGKVLPEAKEQEKEK